MPRANPLSPFPLVMAAILLAGASLGAFCPRADAREGQLDLQGMRETIERLGLGYEVAENWITRLSHDERMILLSGRAGIRPDLSVPWRAPTIRSGPAARFGPVNGRGPAAIDWRDVDGHSYVSGVRNQGVCGSCWDFCAVAAVEAAVMIVLDEPDTDRDLSEQYILSCNDQGSNCNGGFMEVAFEFMRLAGTPPEACFSYYGDHDVPCGQSCANTLDLVQKIESWGHVTAGELDIEAIKTALTFGPVTTGFEIFESFLAYSGGIYSAHGSVTTNGGHCATIVGFDDAEQYWIVKNSWSDGWGEDGYFRMAYDSGCGFGTWTAACHYSPSWGDVVAWTPETPENELPLAVTYNPANRPLEGAGTVILHRGHNGWQGVTDDMMSWNATEEVWEAAVTVPAVATSLQFAFNDDLETWDNNGGADWSILVGEGAFFMDGFLEPGVPLLVSNDGISLWAVRQDDLLYVATEGPHLDDRDQFVLVASNLAASGNAPWAKIGSAVRWDYFLGAEGANQWSSWYDSAEVIQDGPAFARARGDVLEGALDLAVLYAGSPPDTLWLAVAAYATSDGGALDAQCPPGNGDGDLTGDEFHRLAIVTAADPFSFSVSRQPGAAVVTWEISDTGDASRFLVWRERPGRPREPLGSGTLDGPSHLRFIDHGVPVGPVDYWLEENIAGEVVWYGPVSLGGRAVESLLAVLHQNHPNPFNPVTTIRFDLAAAAAVALELFDAEGRLVHTLLAQPLPAGRHEVVWNGRDRLGRPAPSGTYFYRLEAGARIETRRMLLLK